MRRKSSAVPRRWLAGNLGFAAALIPLKFVLAVLLIGWADFIGVENVPQAVLFVLVFEFSLSFLPTGLLLCVLSIFVRRLGGTQWLTWLGIALLGPVAIEGLFWMPHPWYLLIEWVAQMVIVARATHTATASARRAG